MSFDFTSCWRSESIKIPRGQRIGDTWTISGTFGERQRYFAVNFLCSTNSDVPMQFVPQNRECFCMRRFQGKWDTDYRSGTCPNSFSSGKVAPRTPFHLQIDVEADGYRCTLRVTEQDESPVIVCYAHRDPISKTDAVSLTCESYDKDTDIKSFTLFRKTLVLTLCVQSQRASTSADTGAGESLDGPNCCDTEQELAIVCTNCSGTVVATIHTSPNITVSALLMLIESEVNVSEYIAFVLPHGQLVTDEDSEMRIDQLLTMS
eukprot:TRINITY_DN5094_c0_g1_i1.p1 TRINITY_DN5094_c0_g1~~TRINITY_DN5094_c0_g1_i1.p1  ORF type:complete len:262 (-),score=9.47 TRINITY_DN5094_c0_g1_i1:177-962(-)